MIRMMGDAYEGVNGDGHHGGDANGDSDCGDCGRGDAGDDGNEEDHEYADAAGNDDAENEMLSMTTTTTIEMTMAIPIATTMPAVWSMTEVTYGKTNFDNCNDDD